VGGVTAHEAERLSAQAEDRADSYAAGYWAGTLDRLTYTAGQS
jgi:hypothetical protein